MADLTYVKAGPATRERGVALWQKHPDHPASTEYPDGGEVFVAGDRVVQVAKTPEVFERLRDGRLEETDGPSGSPKKGKAAPADAGGGS